MTMTIQDRPVRASVTSEEAYFTHVALLGWNDIVVSNDERREMDDSQWALGVTDTHLGNPEFLRRMPGVKLPSTVVNWDQVDTCACVLNERPQLCLFSTKPSFILEVQDQWVVFWMLKAGILKHQVAMTAAWQKFREGLTYQGQPITIRTPRWVPLAGFDGVNIIPGHGRYHVWELLMQAGLPGKLSAVEPYGVSRRTQPRRLPAMRVEQAAAIEHFMIETLHRLEDTRTPLDITVMTIGARLAAEEVACSTAAPFAFDLLNRRFPGLSYSGMLEWLKEGAGELDVLANAAD